MMMMMMMMMKEYKFLRMISLLVKLGVSFSAPCVFSVIL